MNSPEFVNFITAFMQDMEWAFKLTRYQDNGRWPDEDTDGFHYFLDYLSFMKENLSMVSQRWQGLNSFGPARRFLEAFDSRLRSMMDPTVYTDTYWIWAFFNALGKNFLRQRKPVNWIIELIGAYENWWPTHARAYVQNKFMNLSFGSVRYMINEDMNGYGYTYEVTWQYGWIPGITMWESPIGSDKSFTYELNANETWEDMLLFADSDLPWSERKEYWKNLWKTFVNGSQFASAIKNAWNIAVWDYNKSFYTSDSLSELIQSTAAGKEFYQRWFVTPRDAKEGTTFIKTILNHSQYRPGSSEFTKSLMQFEDLWHMDGAKWNAADAEMELWLQHMKYETNWHWEFILKDWEKQIDPLWTAMIANIKEFWWNDNYVIKTIYDYSKNWLDRHNSDPNYPLYIKLLWQWQAHMLIEAEMEKRMGELNYKGIDKTEKWSEANFNNMKYRDMIMDMWRTIIPWKNMTFFELLNRLDTDNSTLAALSIIQDQCSEKDRKAMEYFFDVEMEADWETVKDINIKPQYKNVLQQIWNVSRAIEEWNVERVLAMSSNLVNMYVDDDPTGMVTASLINSMYDRIYKSPSLTPEQKQEMMIWIFYSNKEYIQHNPEEMRELLWDWYDYYAKLMNEMIYKRDWQVISNLESLQASWDGSKSSTKKAKDVSWAFKDLAMNYWNTWGWTTDVWKRAGQGYWQWVPVQIQWSNLVDELWLKGYAPKNVTKLVFAYKPHADFSVAKDVNRKVNWPKTQAVSKKKQLSKLESDVEKALEAES